MTGTYAQTMKFWLLVGEDTYFLPTYVQAGYNSKVFRLAFIEKNLIYFI